MAETPVPGPSWQDVQRRRLPAESAPAIGAVGGMPGLLPKEDPESPLGRLLAEREQLERRMQTLGGVGQEDPRTAALYQVRPMAERRAEHEAWQARRERAMPRPGAPAPRPPGEPAPPLRERRPAAPADEDPPLRPTPGEQLRRPESGTPVGSRDFMTLRDQLSGLDRGFADADRRLAAEGMEREREDLARMQRDLNLDRVLEGVDKLDKVMAGAEKLDKVIEGARNLGKAVASAEKLARTFDRGSSTADRPERAGKVIDQDWLRRRDRIGGPDHQTWERGFKERSSRLFNVDTGTVAELEERSDRQRGNALQRRRAEREQQDQDEAQRGNALERRRAARDQEGQDEGRRQRALERRRETRDAG